MKHVLTALAALLLPFSLSAQEPVASGGTGPLWSFEESDIPVDPAFRFGVLENGMRYILRSNATPEGQVLVRMSIGSGSLDETDSERGLAHFIEHMAFNGSARIPEGEMVKILEREGLAFGADTNASTGYERTLYKLNLPRNDASLLDTALMLMRETASGLTLSEDAVERERGVLLAERRDRTNYAYRETLDRLSFLVPDARYGKRSPIGEVSVLEKATAADLRALYERTYVPANTVLVIVGDIPVEAMEAALKRNFDDWRGGPDPVEPESGPVDITRAGQTDIYLDPALSEQVTVARMIPWEDRPDTVATRQQNLLRRVAYAIVNRRLQALARTEEPPFRGAGYGTGDIFDEARINSLVVDTTDGEWRKGLRSAALEVRRALKFGFSDAEVNEQLANLRNALENSVQGSATRTNGALMGAALALIDDEQIPSTPESTLARFEAFAPYVTPAATLAALRDDAAPLDQPLIRFRGRRAPEGGAEAIREEWNSIAQAPVTAPPKPAKAAFGYTDFGNPGTLVSDERDERLGFRLLRFANGVRLNLKQTDIREDRLSFRLSLDGGQLLNSKEDPLATSLVSSLPAGGLGKHSQDELQTILAGRDVGISISAAGDAFRISGSTTPEDLELQLQLIAAALTDPGFRREAEIRFRRNIAEFFAKRDATPASALGNAMGGILSDGDPRFTLQPLEDYEALTFQRLDDAIGDRLSQGAIELAIVGDFDEQTAIDAVASTIGALPPRESDFLPREDARQRSFTADRSTRTVYHDGEADQALVRLSWPTSDDSDLSETLHLALLDRVVRIRLQEELREALGKSYSPSTNSSPSRTYRGYGTFNLAASVDVADVEATRAAIRAVIEGLRTEPVTTDTLDRARQPLLERYDNMLKSLGGWLGLADRAQSEADRLQRFFDAPGLLKEATPADIQAAAQRYLAPDEAVEVLVLPRPETETGPATKAADPA
jgi:zinc protease